MVGVATAALVAIAGWAPSTASSGVAVSDLPTLALTVDAGAFAAVNADVNHDTTAMVNVEVTDPGNSQNNLVVADALMVMGSAFDLMVVFLALEIFSVGLHILAGLKR